MLTGGLCCTSFQTNSLVQLAGLILNLEVNGSLANNMIKIEIFALLTNERYCLCSILEQNSENKFMLLSFFKKRMP